MLSWPSFSQKNPLQKPPSPDVTPQDLENIPYLCEKMINAYPDMHLLEGNWSYLYLAKNCMYGRDQRAAAKTSYGEPYYKRVDDNMDILDQTRQGRNVRGKPLVSGEGQYYKGNVHSQKLVEWQYPIDCVDKGFYWWNQKDRVWIPNADWLDSGDMQYFEKKFLRGGFLGRLFLSEDWSQIPLSR